MIEISALPLVLVGPLIRRVSTTTINMWLVSRKRLDFQLVLADDDSLHQHYGALEMEQATTVLSASPHCFFNLIKLPLKQALPLDRWIRYDLQITEKSQDSWQSISKWGQSLSYPGHDRPGFVIPSRIRKVLHGSCRKPHHDSRDGLVEVDKYIANQLNDIEHLPSVLILSGDQIYTDDVAGPMLSAIHELIAGLEFPNETLPSANVNDSYTLHDQQAHYYDRDKLLPKAGAQKQLYNVLFGGAKKPVFTSIHAYNHLISLAEMLAMYLLVWSPECWSAISWQSPKGLDAKNTARFKQEQECLKAFVEELPAIRRVFAHIPIAMIFDDHDITDDWNLTAGWEQAAYNDPFSRRIIGNALIAYCMCQGIGNAPENFSTELVESIQKSLTAPGKTDHNELITDLLKFSHWHYEWPLEPALIVLDTRTHRWRSERNIHQPSGLMDWEAFTDLQQTLLDHQAVIIVSPAPMFGVKLIEIIQRIFTWFGKPLMVDAENWMAHPGAANTLMNLFCHARTPRNFIILSGDVHYSFAYRVTIRGEKSSPKIWQITSSGIRNEFPKSALEVLDRLNRWLFAPWSPLNWFTKRRRMEIVPYVPDTASAGERLVNSAGIGLVSIDQDGKPDKILELSSNGTINEFLSREQDRRWE